MPIKSMKKFRALSVSLLCVLAPLAGMGAESASKLDDQMEEINAAYRKLGRQVSDSAKNADSLKQVAIIREHANASLKLEPKKKADLPSPEQAKFVADYQAKMKEFIAQVGKLEEALKANKNEDATAVLKSLKQAQEDGHKEFRRRKVTFEEKAAAAAKANEPTEK
jgi:soluble cytochrome b562